MFISMNQKTIHLKDKNINLKIDLDIFGKKMSLIAEKARTGHKVGLEI